VKQQETKAGTFRGKFRVELPGKEYMAVRIRRKEIKNLFRESNHAFPV
jgi:hypothetical protein